MSKLQQLIHALTVTIALPFTLCGGGYSQSQKMVRDLEILQSSYEAKYAMTEWKNTLFGLDLAREFDLAKAEVMSEAPLNVKDYQGIVKRIISSMRDLHVGVRFFSTELAYLPFRIQGTRGRYYIVEIDEDYLPDEMRSLSIGDEVVAFNGKSIDQVIQSMNHRLLSPDETEYAFSEAFLTLRMGSKGDLIPSGSVVLETISTITKKPQTHILEWLYFPELIQPRTARITEKKQTPLNPKTVFSHPFFHKDRTHPLYYDLVSANKRIAKSCNKKAPTMYSPIHQIIGYRETKLPPLAPIRWKPLNLDFFDAYIFQTSAGRHVGFIRIPTFYPESSEVAAEEFSILISIMQMATDSLVLDIQGNPGGSYFYMLNLLSMLSPSPMVVPAERMTLTQEDVMFAFEFLELCTFILEEVDPEHLHDFFSDAVDGYTVDKELIENVIRYCEFIIDQWNEGVHLTAPHHIFGIKEIKPNQSTVYTKPILVLIDNLDVSCGDFFPAILQDNQRALLMGQKTAGAGGAVIQTRHHNLFGIESHSITVTVAERPNGQKIENIGVTPDIPYTLTENDLKKGYIDFARAITKRLESKFFRKDPEIVETIISQ